MNPIAIAPQAQNLTLEQAKSFLAWSPAGTYQTSLEGRILDCNAAFAHMMGYDSREAMLAADILEEYYDPAERQTFIAEIKGKGSLVNREMRYRKRGGGLLWALESARLVEGPSVERPIIEGFLVDITDRKRAEVRLALQHRVTRVLAESATLGEAAPRVLQAIAEGLGWELGALWEDGGRQDELRCAHTWQSSGVADPRFEEASLKTPMKMGMGVPGRVWQSREPLWVPDVLADSNFPRLAIAAAAGLHAALAFPVLTGTAAPGVMEFFSRHIEPPDEALLQMLAALGSQVGQFMERKQAEAELKESQEKNLLIIKTALDAVITMNEAGFITDWNPEAERTFGWQREEAIGRRMSETIIPPQYRDAHENGLRQFLATGESRVLNQHIEITAVRRDGAEFPIELAICAERARGIWYFSAFLRDITGRKQAKESLERSNEELERRVEARTRELLAAKEAADAASQAKSEFLANMSHEIRTPMNGIIGMTELALDTELNGDQREYLRTVKLSADSLLAILNDILDFSKIEARKLLLETVEFGLTEGLEDTMKSFALRAHQKGLELACHLQAGIPERLLGDPMRLRQIIVNLVGNAIKFTSRGEVVVRAEVESQDEKQVTLHFAISDTGPGIPIEKQKLIFEAFTQADGSATRKFGGTGLGLTISSQLAQMMGGRIWVESEVGAGSTFHFTVVLGRDEALPEEPLADSSDLDGLRVLVVDDNATNRAILQEMLSRWGSVPVMADGSEAAIARLAAPEIAPFGLLLVDAQMPGKDGFELIEQIRSEPRLTGAAIMMLSSAGQRGDAERCRDLGVAAYLTKPVRQSELREAILRVMGKRQETDSSRSLITRHTLDAKRRALRILLAEDNAVNQTVARRLLEKYGHFVFVAATGREALSLFDKQAFDLVLMDVQMPEMDGFEATAALRQREVSTGRRVPIIAMTAHAMKGDRDRCLAAGMDAYVSKPISTKALLDAIGQVT
ncbi:MAG TPA: response regulator [Terriglobia bacterium]|nr:response regulator [Terriglobia bacterium]